MRRVQLKAGGDGFTVKGLVQGRKANCLLDSGADNSVVPKSLAQEVVPKDWVRACGFMAVSGCTAPRGEVTLALGPVKVVVDAIILSDDMVSQCLIGLDIGRENMVQLITLSQNVEEQVEQAEIRVVQTRAQRQEELAEETEAERVTRRNQPIITPLDIVSTDSVAGQEGEEIVLRAEGMEDEERDVSGEICMVPSEVESNSQEDVVGIGMPELAVGGSMRDEYMENVERDERKGFSVKIWYLKKDSGRQGRWWKTGYMVRGK